MTLPATELPALKNRKAVSVADRRALATSVTSALSWSKHYQTPHLVGEAALAESTAFEHRLRHDAASAVTTHCDMPLGPMRPRASVSIQYKSLRFSHTF
jgi:hypothetical protein